MNYHSKKWESLKRIIMRQDRYLDRIEARYGRRIGAEVVHHIYPAEEYPEYRYEPWNLISVSRATHNRLHDRNTNELTEEGLALMRRTKPGKDWRNNDHRTN